ncbi:MAG TPA: CRTAC1 family protein, partial [Gaiellaceae bacterium]|nr:CRTAC1 family protein [Gaiellaceae bacterium]
MTRLASVAAALLLAIVVFVPGAESSSADVTLRDVAGQVGLDFRQGAFRFGTSPDPVAMMGGGLCWIDYDRDGWLDLYVVNSHDERDASRWRQRGGLPRNALFHNVKGKFVDVSRRSGADLAVRGMGCVAADLDQDGDSDLYVTASQGSALLWNDGKGRFRVASGVAAPGWRSSAAVGDVNGDRLPDLFVGGYTDPNAPIAGSSSGFPTNHAGVRDLLYLNLGRGRFREVGRQAGLEAARFDHTLGAVFSDLDRDGRLDLYVANDEDPNRLYENVAWPGGTKADPAGLGFRFEERAGSAAAADPNAGMGVANADADGDGLADLFVSNSRGQQHAVLNGLPAVKNGAVFADGRSGFAAAFGRSFTGWGVSWADLDLDSDADLVLANGSIPVTNLARDAQPIQVLENRAAQGAPRQFADAGVSGLPLVVGRGLATADFDNDGRLDVAINSIGGRLVLLKGAAPTGNWLEVALTGFHPGARVTAVLPDGRRLVREVQAGSSYLSSEDPRVHFGLGQAATVSELIIRFPSGRETRLGGVSANRLVTV